MPAALPFHGVHVPLVTPFDAAGDVDLGALRGLATRALDAGAAGLVALATTGEPTSLDEEERAAVLAVYSEVCVAAGRTLIVGAGTNDTRTTVARHAALADVPGCTASLAVVPYYVRPSETAIVEHFRWVAERSPVPVLAYNVPYRTGRALGADALLALAREPNIVGVKQAVGAVDADSLRVLAEAPADFALLGGDDAYLFPLTLLGSPGAIAASANVLTDRFVAMVDAGTRGDLATGRPLAEALLPLVLAHFAEPSPAVIKAVLHHAGLIPTPDVRMPLGNASPEAAAAACAIHDALAAG